MKSRRKFIKQGGLAGLGILSTGAMVPQLANALNNGDLPAVLGGQKAFEKTWHHWPIWEAEKDEKAVVDVLRSGVWSRSKVVAAFEKEWASVADAKRCLAVVNGTNALFIALRQFNIGGGDEVIIPPYTFIATAQAVLATGAIPVFADIDPDTFQIDPAKIEARITKRTKAILPVHICGLPADMESIMRIARKYKLLVIEDACQAWLAEIDHKKVGTWGDAGCFSFQNSKNIPMGEGGAIVSDDDAFMDRCYSYHNFGCVYGSVTGGPGFVAPGMKLRLTEYQAAIGLAQLKRLQEQTDVRNKNAAYLKNALDKMPGIKTYKLYPKVTRLALHLFPFRFNSKSFSGLTKSQFLRALSAEGIACEGGYTPLNKMAFIESTFRSKNFKLMYQAEQLDIEKYHKENDCPNCDQICEDTIWFPQNVLLNTQEDMDAIVESIKKIYKYSLKIKTALI